MLHLTKMRAYRKMKLFHIYQSIGADTRNVIVHSSSVFKTKSNFNIHFDNVE